MNPDPYKYFRVEAHELLQQLGQGILDLEKGLPTEEAVPRLLRLAHTLKGAARVVKRLEIAENAHALEDALAPLRGEAPSPDREQVDRLLAILDGISASVGQLASPIPAPDKPDASEVPPPPGEPPRTLYADVSEMDLLVEGLTQVSVHVGSMMRGVRDAARIRPLSDLLAAQFARFRATPTGDLRPNGDATRTIVWIDELRSIASSFEAGFTRRIEQLDREIRQTREMADRLRLTPVDSLFPVLERAARDAARVVGNRVRFTARCGDVRLDAQVISALQGALIQIVRNAVAHGIEPESERTSAGKAAVGTLSIEVVRRSGRVSFSCSDDGRGVDLGAVRRIAREKGLLDEQGDSHGVKELIQLLLRGGLSTSRRIDEVAGRGIGLDVVRETASRLGGEVDVRTEAGRGTTVEIVVPISMSSLDALVVEASGLIAAIPIADVRRGVCVTAGDLARTTDGEAIVDGEDVIPFVRLADVLGVTAAMSGERQSWSALIVKSRTGAAAFGVDQLLGRTRLVSCALPPLTPAHPTVAGAYLDADGNPRIVLDAEGLLAAALQARPRARSGSAPTRPPVLVIDDSLTTRMLEQSILASAGYEVDLAVSGEDALEKAEQREYALFLVDVEMPGIDGFTFIERMRANPATRHVPAILVTSRDSAEDRRRGRDAGAAGHVLKGEFDQREFLDRVRQLVG